MRRLGSNDPCGLVSCTRYGDVDEVSEALAPAGVEPVVLFSQAGTCSYSVTVGHPSSACRGSDDRR